MRARPPSRKPKFVPAAKTVLSPKARGARRAPIASPVRSVARSAPTGGPRPASRMRSLLNVRGLRLAKPLAPGDPVAVNAAVLPGPYPTYGNVIETNTAYTMGQEDQVVLVVQNAATITLCDDPLTAYLVWVIADGGAVTVQGTAETPIQGGTVTVAEGTVAGFSYSPISGTWSVLRTGTSTPSGETTVIETANVSVPAYTNVLANSTGGAFTVTLNGGLIGSTYEVDDYGMDAATNNITIAVQAGQQIEDPNNPGAYQLAGASVKLIQNGQSARWRYDGISKYKLVAQTS
jgi:hypothetical protein